MSAWDIYWLTRLEPIGKWLGDVAFVIALTSFVLLMIAAYARSTKVDAESLRMGAKVLSLALVLSLVSKFLPTNKDLAIIFAGSWAANSEEVKALPENVVKTMNKFMTDYLDEGTGKDKP